MIIIDNIKIDQILKYFWLKNVKDVDLNQHCAKCLIGEYNKKINAFEKEFSNIQLENGVYYLCGVSYPFIYDNNFHLAFKYSENSNIEIQRNDVSIYMKNAVELPINAEHIDLTHSKAKFKSYYTCRNWQFANYFKKHLT